MVSIALAATTITGCGAMCEAQAQQEINELKQIVLRLLPKTIAETVAEEDDCDSGSGGSLSFRADPALMTSEQIFEKFLAEGWSRIDEPRDGCLICVDGLDGVSTEWGGQEVYLRITNSDGFMDILAAFA
ncbi:hypothetical protein HD597_009490 [Nonomuraea thailandensis]|uniref:Uncharacterized protein n=1 Tax=Nonomuraea thailandensis TaxID=1188745 RepID=A0A9X2K7E0_9ACTN|nr:hypothetical protein [Nonomuraea thailandensis]MCP2362470.1 hypothetical protein [Nonomuraea thailandensis]